MLCPRCLFHHCPQTEIALRQKLPSDKTCPQTELALRQKLRHEEGKTRSSALCALPLPLARVSALYLLPFAMCCLLI